MWTYALRTRGWTQRHLIWVTVRALGVTVAVASLASLAGCGSSEVAPPLISDGCGAPAGSASICPCGTVLYRLQAGLYETRSTEVRQDGCGLGLTAELLRMPRQVSQNTADGTITISGQDVRQALLRGPIRCNSGKLVYGPQVVTDGQCQYTLTRTGTLQLTADNTATLVVEESRQSVSSVAGMTCTQPDPCKIVYALGLYKPVQ